MGVIKTVKISEPKPNEHNPRYINKANFKKLVNSLKEFPKMLEVRPLVVDENMIVLGGNMRLKALIEAGFKEVLVHQVLDWTDDEKNQFIIKDNSSFGSWDWEILANEWNMQKIVDWGVDLPKEMFAEEDDPIQQNTQDEIPKEICPTCGSKMK
jgi:ParB-like chromosome segregation protein Spo0J